MPCSVSSQSSKLTSENSVQGRNVMKQLGAHFCLMCSFFTPHNCGSLFSLTVPTAFNEGTCFIIPDDKADATLHLWALFKWDINNFFQDPGEWQSVTLETGFKFVSGIGLYLR